jgi:hypothetical protein
MQRAEIQRVCLSESRASHERVLLSERRKRRAEGAKWCGRWIELLFGIPSTSWTGWQASERCERMYARWRKRGREQTLCVGDIRRQARSERGNRLSNVGADR